ncbi:MAG TPA: 4-hydroxy-3-methylbut-2-enyl diphosphate reductase [Actinomycetota bacterium]
MSTDTTDQIPGPGPGNPVPDFRAPARVLLAAPRGYCAGVDRAIEIVEVALQTYGPPVYVRKQIVHNHHVVRRLEELGAVFVEELGEVPQGATVVFSAHGVAPSVHAEARERHLRVIDATCPLVTKVHQEARKFAAQGYDIVLIGHEGHEEVAGTMGQAAAAIHLVSDEDEAGRVRIPDPRRVAYLTQTTLSVDETVGVVDRLRERFPALAGPRSDDICYATQNRQAAVKALAADCELILVIGSDNSSNSQRLVEVARGLGCQSHLIPDAAALDPSWFEGVATVGVTSGASAPEWLVADLVEALRERGAREVREVPVVPEDVHFALPRTLQQDARGQDAQRGG